MFLQISKLYNYDLKNYRTCITVETSTVLGNSNSYIFASQFLSGTSFILGDIPIIFHSSFPLKYHAHIMVPAKQEGLIIVRGEILICWGLNVMLT